MLHIIWTSSKRCVPELFHVGAISFRGAGYKKGFSTSAWSKLFGVHHVVLHRPVCSFINFPWERFRPHRTLHR
eukprot:8247681-Ditylum_brightwellii.AAC.1